MKAYLLASVPVFVLAAGSAQAITLYEQDSTSLDLYGRLRLQIVNDDGENAFENQSSRFGLGLQNQVDERLAVFANAEFRFRADETNREPMQIRNSYLGLELTDLGRFTAGNFDSIYNQQISDVLDLPENTGWRALNEGGERARGDTLAFDSESFAGVRFGVSVKHQAQGIYQGQAFDEAVNAMAYLGYAAGPLNIVMGYDQANQDFVDGEDDPLYGVRADYDALENVNIGYLAESQGDLTHLGLSAVYEYASGKLYGLVSQMDLDDEADDLQYMIGVRYSFSEPMYTYLEYAGSSDSEINALGRDVVTLGARYNF